MDVIDYALDATDNLKERRTGMKRNKSLILWILLGMGLIGVILYLKRRKKIGASVAYSEDENDEEPLSKADSFFDEV